MDTPTGTSVRGPKPGAWIDSFELVRVSPRPGADGWICKALRDGETFFVVVLSPEAEPSIGAELEHERLTLRRIPTHVEAIGVSEQGTWEGLNYYAGEWATGERLSARIGKERIRVRERLELILALLDVMIEVHAAGVLHRYLSASAVRVCAGERPFVVDFKRATLLGKAQPPGEESGEPEFRAPEQILGDPQVGAAADQHALGALAYSS